MDWRKFVVFNFLGAVLWVTAISCVGYFFGEHWEQLVRIIRHSRLVVVLAICGVALFFWWKRRHRQHRLQGGNQD